MNVTCEILVHVGITKCSGKSRLVLNTSEDTCNLQVHSLALAASWECRSPFIGAFSKDFRLFSVLIKTSLRVSVAYLPWFSAKPRRPILVPCPFISSFLHYQSHPPVNRSYLSFFAVMPSLFSIYFRFFTFRFPISRFSPGLSSGSSLHH